MWSDLHGSEVERKRIQKLVNEVCPVVWGSAGPPLYWRIDVIYSLCLKFVHVGEIEVCGAEYSSGTDRLPTKETLKEFVPGYLQARNDVLAAVNNNCKKFKKREWFLERIAALILATMQKQ